ncbi:large ribosomal subunit protein eL29-like [Tenrec ecaudatus]|uniref:large ribosomal subunit protein eL29-like n=1 Tax=Tenrec ecaudatus TaxID=94439 RepID=UPI003F591BBF
MHNQSPPKGIKKPRSQQRGSFQGVGPKFLRHKYNRKGLKKTQAYNTQAVDAHTGAINALVTPKEVKAKSPMGINCKLDRVAYSAYPKLGKRTWAHTAKSLRLCRPKAKTQGKADAPAKALTPV